MHCLPHATWIGTTSIRFGLALDIVTDESYGAIYHQGVNATGVRASCSHLTRTRTIEAAHSLAAVSGQASCRAVLHVVRVATARVWSIGIAKQRRCSGRKARHRPRAAKVVWIQSRPQLVDRHRIGCSIHDVPHSHGKIGTTNTAKALKKALCVLKKNDFVRPKLELTK